MQTFKAIKAKLFSVNTTIPQVLQTDNFRSLGGLRAVAILLVIASHLSVGKFLLKVNLIIDGKIGVHIFFVLSGFLITTLLLKRKIATGAISLKNFYIRRILRIVPLVYIFLLVILCINVVYERQIIPTSDIAYSFLFLKNLPIKNTPLTAHLWTVSVEEQFYIIIPFLIYLNVNRYFSWALFLIIVFPLISIASYNFPDLLSANLLLKLISKGVNYSFWKGPIILLIGSVASMLTFTGILNLNWGKKYYYLSFILLIIAIIISSTNFYFYNKYVSEYLSAILVAYVILLNIHSENFLCKILNNRILVQIGLVSYSLYIWQQLFIGKYFWMPFLRWLNFLPFAGIVVAKLIILFCLANLSYYIIELPFLKMKAKFK
ncbi:MAG: Peptidoglycan/LPS O-acetylase OafA/YrhL, contains acyltransferase and SGNH-hydrolase domain [Daejeonella sp.]|nr:Peptidoglycan/LPS O-acetylase OafA/YrhL, contains acyltransferase and SGNH-hydrolase domain [Daejeonella sp.]